MDRVLWNQSYLLFGQGLTGSALIGALPVFTLLILLGIPRELRLTPVVSNQRGGQLGGKDYGR